MASILSSVEPLLVLTPLHLSTLSFNILRFQPVVSTDGLRQDRSCLLLLAWHSRPFRVYSMYYPFHSTATSFIFSHIRYSSVAHHTSASQTLHPKHLFSSSCMFPTGFASADFAAAAEVTSIGHSLASYRTFLPNTASS